MVVGRGWSNSSLVGYYYNKIIEEIISFGQFLSSIAEIDAELISGKSGAVLRESGRDCWVVAVSGLENRYKLLAMVVEGRMDG